MINAEDRAKAGRVRKEQLTLRQKKIIQAYFDNFNKSDAYASCCKEEKKDIKHLDIKAYRFFKNPKVVAEINRILDNVDIVKYVKDNLYQLSKTANASERLRALELLGKTKAMFVEKTETVNAPIPVQIIQLTEAQHNKLINSNEQLAIESGNDTVDTEVSNG